MRQLDDALVDAPPNDRVERWYPSAITVLGLFLSVAALVWRSPPLMGFALVCDVLDGWLARRLDAASRFGAELDWHVDVAVAAALAYALSPWLLVPLAVWTAVAKRFDVHVSGRAALAVAWAAIVYLSRVS